jgi:flagellar biosynthesis protein FliQ
MDSNTAVTIVGQAIVLVAKVAGPILVATLCIGLIISVFQSVTSVQESSLSFLPKLVVVAALLSLTGHWMLNEVLDYTEQLYNSIPKLVSG